MAAGVVEFDGLSITELGVTSTDLSEGILRRAEVRDPVKPLNPAHVVVLRTERRTGPFAGQKLTFYCGCHAVSCRQSIAYERYIERTAPKPPSGGVAVAA